MNPGAFKMFVWDGVPSVIIMAQTIEQARGLATLPGVKNEEARHKVMGEPDSIYETPHALILNVDVR